MEEMIEQLQKTLAQIDAESLYGKKICKLIDQLQRGQYSVNDQLIPANDLIFELQSLGFFDLAKKLTWKGDKYER